jgi:hypothetical protein
MALLPLTSRLFAGCSFIFAILSTFDTWSSIASWPLFVIACDNRFSLRALVNRFYITPWTFVLRPSHTTGMTWWWPMKFMTGPMLPGMFSIPILIVPVAITAPITPVVMEIIVINPMISKRHVIDAWNTCFILTEIIELMLSYSEDLYYFCRFS